MSRRKKGYALVLTTFCSNKPVIASNLPGFREVTDDMSTGLLVDVLTPENLAYSIVMLIEDEHLRNNLSQNI